MFTFLLMVHVTICVLLVISVLLQAGKGGGLAGSFGAGGGGQALFGGRGAGTFLTKATVVLGALFFVSSVGLAFLSSQGQGVGTRRSLVQEAAQKTTGGTAPATGTPSGETPIQAPATGAPAPAPKGPGSSPPANPQGK
jgi:preprotein translocase subunit SecG